MPDEGQAPAPSTNQDLIFSTKNHLLTSDQVQSVPLQNIPTIPEEGLLPIASKRNTLTYFLIGIIIFILVAAFSIVGTIYAIAYGYYDLDNPQLKQTITHYIRTLPFAPQ